MAPHGDVHFVHALVANLAVAVLPEIMPVVMDVQPWLFPIGVDHEFVIARRSLPQIPVEILRDRARFTVADRAAIAVLVNVAARLDDLADEAVVNQLHVANERRVRATLRAVLHDFAVLFRGGHELPAFENVVGKRLFDVHVLARLAGPDRRQRVPMVRRRDGHRVDALVGERLANIAIQFGPLALGFFDDLRAALEDIGVDVAKRDVFGFILHFEDVLDVRAALAVEADRANADSAIHVARGGRTGGSRGNYGGGTGRQKGSSS